MGQAAQSVILASSLFSAGSQVRAGNAAKAEAKARIKDEKMKGREAQIARQEDLLNELSRRRAIQGAGGGTPEGSFAAGQRREIELADQDLLAINATTAANSRRLRQQGKNARSQGRLGATSSLLKGGTNLALLK